MTLAQNQAAWDRMAETGSIFAAVASDDECRNPLAVLDGRGWLPAAIRGLDVLCLAAGGGWQSILYACAGASVTVVDISPSMLRLDEREAARRNLTVRTIEDSMDNLTHLGAATFDLVHQPVSTCYVPKLAPVYREIARVLRPGGLYISQHKQPTSLQVTHRDSKDRYVLGIEYHHSGVLPPVPDRSYREPGAAEYVHSWQELIGELCRAGFLIEDLCEPDRSDRAAAPGHFAHRACYVPPYVRLKARKRTGGASDDAPKIIWAP